MKRFFSLLTLLVLTIGTSAQAQRQTSLYIDDGHGNFLQMIASALSHGRQISFPDPGGNASVLLSSAGQTITGGLTVTGGLASGAFTLPTTMGNSNDVITSNGSGGSSWQPSSGSGFTPQVLYEKNDWRGFDQLLDASSPLVFNEVGYVSGLSYNAVTGVVTVNSAGVYEVEFSVNLTTFAIFAVWVNFSPFVSIPCAENTLTSTSVLIQLNAGDQLWLSPQTSGAFLTGISTLETDASMVIKRVL